MKKTGILIALVLTFAVLLAGCGNSGSAQFSDIGTGEVPELGTATIDGSYDGFSDIGTGEVPELGTATIDAPEYDFSEIRTILPPGDLSVVLTMPDYDFQEITVQDVTLSIPVIDYEISFDRIGSAYTDTYTLPSVQIDVPEFDDEMVKGTETA